MLLQSTESELILFVRIAGNALNNRVLQEEILCSKMIYIYQNGRRTMTAASIMLDGIIDDLEIAVGYLEKHQAAYTDENCVSLFGSQEWQRIALTVSPPIPIRNFGDIQAWVKNNYQGKIPGRDHVTIAEAIEDFKTALVYFKHARETGTYRRR